MNNELIMSIIVGLSFSGMIVLWISGLDYVKKNHPDDEDENHENQE